jgi:hypothetical protein
LFLFLAGIAGWLSLRPTLGTVASPPVTWRLPVEFAPKKARQVTLDDRL